MLISLQPGWMTSFLAHIGYSQILRACTEFHDKLTSSLLIKYILLIWSFDPCDLWPTVWCTKQLQNRYPFLCNLYFLSFLILMASDFPWPHAAFCILFNREAVLQYLRLKSWAWVQDHIFLVLVLSWTWEHLVLTQTPPSSGLFWLGLNPLLVSTLTQTQPAQITAWAQTSCSQLHHCISTLRIHATIVFFC